MSNTLDLYLQQARQRINTALQQQLGNFNSPFTDLDTRPLSSRLQQAMAYSLLNGGKRVRAVLVYAAADAITGTATSTAPSQSPALAANLDKVACALEMIHAYSLIHDDLPAMDDDDLRRGQPSCHKAFDEATAILAGDALQARAIELLTELSDCPAATALRLVQLLANAAGQQGMVAGQAIDLYAVDKAIDIDHLEALHRLKTGALIRAAIAMGATLAAANQSQLLALDHYGANIGLAFQVQDDILDIEGDTVTLGKTQGADLALNKPTYPSLLGIDGARQKASQLHQQALSSLTEFSGSADVLRELSGYIISRNH